MGIATSFLAGFDLSGQFIEQVFSLLQQCAMLVDCIDREALND